MTKYEYGAIELTNAIDTITDVAVHWAEERVLVVVATIALKNGDIFEKVELEYCSDEIGAGAFVFFDFPLAKEHLTKNVFPGFLENALEFGEHEELLLSANVSL